MAHSLSVHISKISFRGILPRVPPFISPARLESPLCPHLTSIGFYSPQFMRTVSRAEVLYLLPPVRSLFSPNHPGLMVLTADAMSLCSHPYTGLVTWSPLSFFRGDRGAIPWVFTSWTGGDRDLPGLPPVKARYRACFLPPAPEHGLVPPSGNVRGLDRALPPCRSSPWHVAVAMVYFRRAAPFDALLFTACLVPPLLPATPGPTG